MSQIEAVMGMQELLKQIRIVHEDQFKPLEEALNAAIEKGVKKAVKHNKVFKMNVNLTFTPGTMNQIDCSAQMDVKEPKPSSAPLLAYTDKQGRLVGEDPNQTKLPLTQPSQLERKE